MNLYDRSVLLQVKLGAAQANSVDDELVDRGQRVAVALAAATDDFGRLGEFRRALGLAPPPVDTKSVGKAVRALRAGLAKSQAAAFQQKATTNLQDVVRDQVKVGTTWAKANWKEVFGPWDSAIDRGRDASLIGDPAHRQQVASIAHKLGALRAQDPLSDRAAIDERLKVSGPGDWIPAIANLGVSLEKGLEDLDRLQEALDPEVRQVLDRANAGGFPLTELTSELLERLVNTGVAVDLTVRRA